MLSAIKDNSPDTCNALLYLNELDIILAQEMIVDATDPDSITIPIFQTSIIKLQLDALSLDYGKDIESVICDIPENHSCPGSK